MDRVAADPRRAARMIVRVVAVHSFLRLFRAAVGHSPDRPADVVGDEQRAGPIDRNSDRPAARLAVGADKASDEAIGSSDRPAAGEADEYHPIAVELAAGSATL